MALTTDDKLVGRIEKILQLNLKLVNAGNKSTGKIAENETQLDAIISGLEAVTGELDAKTRFISERTSRLNDMLDVLLEYTIMDFSKKIAISDKGDEVDAVALGINTLGEELDSHISQLKGKTEDLTRSNKQLEEFVYIASHDLQEPLKTLSNYTDLLQQDLQGKLDESALRYLTRVTAATERMRMLVIDLLEYARVGKDPIVEEVDCNALVHEVLTDMTASIESNKAGIQLEPLPVIQGNYSELKSLFQNLLSNAIKFKQPDVPPMVRVKVTEGGNEWTFAVEDNGIGIDERFHDRIFFIFQKLHSRKQYAGTGIGLAHCKKVVEHHRGNIWLQSEAGKGSKFYFTIPKIKQ